MSLSRILMIDDEPAFLKLLGRRLEGRGYEVIATDDPHQGVALAAAHRPDVILLDLYMPGLDGYELAKLLRADERTRAIPIVVLSAAHQPRFRKKSLDWGADAHVAKGGLGLPEDLGRALDRQGISVARKDEPNLAVLFDAIDRAVAGRKAAPDGRGAGR